MQLVYPWFLTLKVCFGILHYCCRILHTSFAWGTECTTARYSIHTANDVLSQFLLSCSGFTCRIMCFLATGYMWRKHVQCPVFILVLSNGTLHIPDRTGLSLVCRCNIKSLFTWWPGYFSLSCPSKNRSSGKLLLYTLLSSCLPHVFCADAFFSAHRELDFKWVLTPSLLYGKLLQHAESSYAVCYAGTSWQELSKPWICAVDILQPSWRQGEKLWTDKWCTDWVCFVLCVS